MKFTLSWLKEHLETDASLHEIGEALTNIGLEVEEITDRAAEFAPFKVANVEKAEKHPDADKLQVCTVKTPDHGTVQVVCGAPNARAGMKAIFAPDGSYIPGLDVTLKATKIRGVESNGMLVSEKEMCLSDEHNGIIDLPEDTEIGTPMAVIFGLDDPAIEIALTPNRADCAGIRGIARDLAAAGLGTLKDIDDAPLKGTFKSPINVKLEDEGCTHFIGRTIRGIKNGPSPKWVRDKLQAIGLRPISALVDITNLMTMEYGRPLHVFDADKIKGDITVRTAKTGETFDALNDKSYETVGAEIAITDENGILGLGGIVGGTSTGCEEDTVNVFVEAAYFDPARIARTGRDLGVSSDARYRFERGVDPEFTATGMELATKLIIDICATDSTEISEVVEAGGVINWQREIEFDPAYTKKLIGVDVPAQEQKDILEALGFDVKGDKIWSVTPPSWRGDVIGKADLTEEVIRIVGFDKIPSHAVLPAGHHYASAETPMLTRGRLARGALALRGLNECVTWSFTNHEKAAQFNANDNADLAALTLKNAISSELDVMRPSILPNLIEAAGRNAARGYEDSALCEIGPVFRNTKPDGQDIVAAGIRAGHAGTRHWADSNAARNVDVFDAKQDALAALAAVGAPAGNAQISRDAPDYFHPGRSGALRLGPNVLAYFGEIHPALLEEMDVKGPLVGFEVFLQNVPEPKKKSGTEKTYLTLEPLQPLSRDFAFVVDADVAASDIVRAAIGADKNLITGGDVFDIYTGKGVDEGQKSVALNITIQPKGETLTDADLEGLTAKVIGAVEKRTGGVLRG